MTSDRISVVVIFLNAERFLGEAIESVMAQTHPAWELLLVDDGSSDGSSLIARRAAAASPERVRYLAHPDHQNRGMSASRNLGAASASGDVIAFLDADDVFFPRALETLVGVLDRQPLAAMAYGPVEYWYSWAGTDAVGRDFIQPLGVPAPALLEPPELLLRFLRRRAAAPSGMLVRAAVFREVGGFEDEFRGMYEDQAFCAKVCLHRAVVTTSDCVYRYRQHPGSSSAAADRGDQPDFGRNAFLHWLQGYLVEQDLEAGPVAAALRKERWWLQHPRLHRLARRLRATPHTLADRVRRLTARRSARRVLEPQ